jgi:hypothetical protein
MFPLVFPIILSDMWWGGPVGTFGGGFGGVYAGVPIGVSVPPLGAFALISPPLPELSPLGAFTAGVSTGGFVPPSFETAELPLPPPQAAKANAIINTKTNTIIFIFLTFILCPSGLLL